MHCLLIRCVRTHLNPKKYRTKTNSAFTRQFSSSAGCKMKKIETIDDDGDDDDFMDFIDEPTYCEDSNLFKKTTKSSFKKYMEQKYNFPPTVAADVWLSYPEFRERSLYHIEKNAGLLTAKGVTTAVILDNLSLLTIENFSLCARLRIVENMKPDTVDDFAPLAILPEERLAAIKIIAEKEERVITNRHRIYHLSTLLDMKPPITSKYVTERLFLLELPFEDVDLRIKLMLNYMNPAEVVTSMKAVKRRPERIESRLAKSKQLNMKMSAHKVTAPPSIWIPMVERVTEMNELFGNESRAQYFAKRLNCEIETAENLLVLHPALAKCNLSMMNKKLDFLLNEAGIKGSDIVLAPLVLYRRFDLMKKRIQELQLYDCRQNCILNYAHSSSKKYSKLIDKLKKRETEAVNKE